MFKINNSTKEIQMTRGDYGVLRINAINQDGSEYTFNADDIVRIKVYKKNDCNVVVMKKDTIVETPAKYVDIIIEKEDSKIGDVISKDVDYWYEVELNPNTFPQTIIGYEIVDGEKKYKIFKLLPEGADTND